MSCTARNVRERKLGAISLRAQAKRFVTLRDRRCDWTDVAEDAVALANEWDADAFCGRGLFSTPLKDARDPAGAKAPGKPGAAEGFEDPKTGEEWGRDPNGRGAGWKDKDGNVWVPTGPKVPDRGMHTGGRTGMFRTQRPEDTETYVPEELVDEEGV